MDKLFIISATYKQARDFAHENGLNKHDFIHVSNPHNLRGIRGGYFVRLHGFFDGKIELMLASREMIKIHPHEIKDKLAHKEG